MQGELSHMRAVLVTVAVAALGLAVAQGIGRFAFTPLLPLMQARSGVTLAQGAWLAAANYLGYFAGALYCTVRGPAPMPAARGGLVVVAVFTTAMGLTHAIIPALVFRFVAGVGSAFSLVGLSAVAMGYLATVRREHWAGWVFAGIGCGVTMAGLVGLGLGVAGLDPALAWLGLGIAAFAGTVPLWRLSPLQFARTGPAPRVPFDADAWRLIGSYAAYGFGYIIPATFLPALARSAVADPAIFGWTWPVFGLAAALSTVLASTLFRTVPPRRLWAWCEVVLAVGVLLPAWRTELWVLLISALCVGGTFVVITMAGMQEARRCRGAAALPLMSAMTAAFAAGQVAGPIAVSLFPSGPGAVRIPSVLAAALLLLGAWSLLRHRPQPDAGATPRP